MKRKKVQSKRVFFQESSKALFKKMVNQTIRNKKKTPLIEIPYLKVKMSRRTKKQKILMKKSVVKHSQTKKKEKTTRIMI